MENPIVNLIIARPPDIHQPNAYYNILYLKNLPFAGMYVEISSTNGFFKSIVVKIKRNEIVPQNVAWVNSKIRDHLDLKIGQNVYLRPISRNSLLNIPIISNVIFEIGFLNDSHSTNLVYNSDDIRRGLIASENQHSVLTIDQPIIIWMPENPKIKIFLKVLSISNLIDGKFTTINRGRYIDVTSIQLVSNKEFPIKLEKEQKRVFNVNEVDILKFGIGGVNKEFEEMVRTILAPRLISKELQDKLDIKHEKGIIFYGPPGTGKTLMARNLCKMLNTREPKIVRGPEIMSKFVGQAEENIRMLFKEAEEDYAENGEKADLHIIVFDEIDSIAGKRKNGGVGEEVNNKVVAQILSVIDGVNPINNVILIGTTNRLDMIDEAILRPGRFGIKIMFSLPDLLGREQIFQIHMEKVLSMNLVEDDVTISDLALRTKNYTGAEIEDVVKKALSYVIMNEVDLSNLKNIEKFTTKISHAHFMNALKEVKPAYGTSEDLVLSSDAIHNSGIEFDNLLSKLKEYTEQLVESKVINTSSILLHGISGSGKSTLAIKTAIDSMFPYVKIINPEKLLELVDDNSKCRYIVDIFKESHKSEMAVIIFDDIEDLIQYVKIGSRYSPYVHQTISTILSTKSKNKLLIIGTTSKLDVLEDMGLVEKFRYTLEIPEFSKEYMSKVLGYEPIGDMPARDAMLEIEKLKNLAVQI